MEALRAILDYQYFNNTVRDYAYSLLTLVGFLLSLMIGKQVLVSRLGALAQKTKTDLDDLLVGLLARIGPPTLIVISLYAATFSLELDENVRKIVNYSVVIALTLRGVVLLQELAC